MDSPQPVQEDFSIMTFTTEQEAMEQKNLVKHFNISVTHHFYSIKITKTWNAITNEVVSSKTVNSSRTFGHALGRKSARCPS